MKIPQVGQRVLIETSGLPGGLYSDKTYSFSIHRSVGSIVIHVPGHHMGPDICKPELPEQERFLDGHNEIMTRSWGCQWTLHDCMALESFMEIVENILEKYQVVIG